MDVVSLMKARHSVRQYTNKKIEDKKRKELDQLIQELNEETGLHIQIFYDEPDCFRGNKTHYGKFTNVRNYIALVGKKDRDLEENCGYYGELLVMKAQELGLNTCWVALTHGKSKAKVLNQEKEVCLIVLGYGENQGVPHRKKELMDVCRVFDEDGKRMTDLSSIDGVAPDWFVHGVQAALLAPTAMNQQKFLITYDGCSAHFKAKMGFFTKLDLGIVEYHFETVAELYQ